MGVFRFMMLGSMTIVAAVGAIVVTAVYGFLLTAPPGSPQASQASIGRQLYATNCAKCHGTSLEGQPDWMKRNENGRLPAPPHDETGHTWHHSDKQLFTITKFGLQSIAPGYETDMQVFENVLSDEDITTILTYIKSTWPERQKGFQAARSAADPP